MGGRTFERVMEILKSVGSLDSNTLQHELYRVRGPIFWGSTLDTDMLRGKWCQEQSQCLLTVGPLPSHSYPGLAGKFCLLPNLNPFC